MVISNQAARRFRAAAAMLMLSGVLASAAPRLAILPPENRTGDPRLDYIGGIVHGLLQFDLSSDGAVVLVDRSVLDAALKEKELSLSAAAADPGKPMGDLLPADSLLSCEYAILGGELLFTAKLVDVATSRVSSFSEGGSTENAVHAVAERTAERLTGQRPKYREPGNGRSLLSLRDETPGSIAVHSPLIDAEIFLDGEFVGYTTGDRRKPFVLESVPPGDHVVSTDLGADFGVIGLPEVSFGPWQKTVRVQPGRRVVVMDESSHFNDALYRMVRLVDYSKPVAFDSDRRFKFRTDFSFVDRSGTKRSGMVSVDLSSSPDSSSGTGAIELALGPDRAVFPIAYGPDSPADIKGAAGIVALEAGVSARYGRVELDVEVSRSDIRQGMHRENDALRR